MTTLPTCAECEDFTTCPLGDKCPVTSWIEEGMEWTDGFFAYIAYRKSDGTMVIRDLERFDYDLDDWVNALIEDEKLILVDEGLEYAEHIKRWEGEVEVLPRDPLIVG